VSWFTAVVITRSKTFSRHLITLVGLMAYGIGAISLGGQYVSRFFNVRPVVGSVESGFGCIVVEMGIGGLILWMVMSITVLFHAWKVVIGLKGSPWFPLRLHDFLVRRSVTHSYDIFRDDAISGFHMNAYMWLLAWGALSLAKVGLSASSESNPPLQQFRGRWSR